MGLLLLRLDTAPASRSIVLGATLVLALVAPGAFGQSKAIYSCVDAGGKRITSDRPIARARR